MSDWDYEDDDWYDDYDYDCGYYRGYHQKPDSYYEALEKNERLIDNFRCNQQGGFCGNVGVRRVKLSLNNKAKNGDNNALMYRLALEIENKNIIAKETSYRYKDKVYAQKSELIRELNSVCRDNDVVYGIQKTDNYSTNYVIYYELPNMEQISFHNNFTNDEINDIPKYTKPWDEKVNSTMGKIEAAINAVYGAELKAYNEKVEVGAKKRAAAKQKKLQEARRKNVLEVEIPNTINLIKSRLKSVNKGIIARFLKLAYLTNSEDWELKSYIYPCDRLKELCDSVQMEIPSDVTEMIETIRNAVEEVRSKVQMIPQEVIRMKELSRQIKEEKKLYLHRKSLLETDGVEKHRKLPNKIKNYEKKLSEYNRLKAKYPNVKL